MARTNTNAELWKAVSQFGYMDDSTSTPLSTTTDTATAVGATTIGVASTANGSTGTFFRLGNAGAYEIGKIEAMSTGGITLVSATAYAHASGVAVVEQTRTDLGDISDDGVNVEVVMDRTRIDAATQRHAYDYNINHTEYRVTVSLENLSNENMAVIMGIPETNITGTGVAADPSIVDWTPDNIASIDPLHFWFRGTLGNGDTVEIQAWDARIDASKSITFARGQDAPASLVFNCSHLRYMRPV